MKGSQKLKIGKMRIARYLLKLMDKSSSSNSEKMREIYVNMLGILRL